MQIAGTILSTKETVYGPCDVAALEVYDVMMFEANIRRFGRADIVGPFCLNFGF